VVEGVALVVDFLCPLYRSPHISSILFLHIFGFLLSNAGICIIWRSFRSIMVCGFGIGFLRFGGIYAVVLHYFGGGQRFHQWLHSRLSWLAD
jgi:hypothetical protein